MLFASSSLYLFVSVKLLWSRGLFWGYILGRKYSSHRTHLPIRLSLSIIFSWRPPNSFISNMPISVVSETISTEIDQYSSPTTLSSYVISRNEERNSMECVDWLPVDHFTKVTVSFVLAWNAWENLFITTCVKKFSRLMGDSFCSPSRLFGKVESDFWLLRSVSCSPRTSQKEVELIRTQSLPIAVFLPTHQQTRWQVSHPLISRVNSSSRPSLIYYFINYVSDGPSHFDNKRYYILFCVLPFCYPFATDETSSESNMFHWW